jgi:tetratricopeptide (TPR) repeat protein
MRLTPGTRLDHFEIVAELGRGGMGSVFRAHDTALDRDVAIKVLREEVATDPARLERFKREARAASALNHPNIVTIHEIAEIGESLYLVMELVNGHTLRDLVRKGPLDPEEIVDTALQVAGGLAKAHAAGIVHRDLKPENLMVTPDGLVKILDFGLAKLVHPDEGGDERPTLGALTNPGALIGTVQYMSPEQIAGGEFDARSDQFSLGTILYELGTGSNPFRVGSQLQALSAILKEDPAPIADVRPELPRGLASIIERLLSKEPADRFDDTRELVSDLKAVRLQGSPSPLPGASTLPWFLQELSTDEESPEGSFFVGRERELARLTEAIDSAVAGRGRLTLVTGDAGAGKTALLQELARRCRRRHEALVTVSGHCDAQTGIGDPYLPFRQILALLTGDVETRRSAGAMSLDNARRLWSVAAAATRALTTTAPDLVGSLVAGEPLLGRARHFRLAKPDYEALERLVTQKERQGESPSVQQGALIEQCIQLLLDVSRQQPLLVMLEDLHWADEGTASLLSQLCRRIEDASAFVVATYRPAEVTRKAGDEEHPLESLVRDLKGRLRNVEVAVGAEDDRDFVDAVIDATPNHLGEGFRQALCRQTQGHALFTTELLRDLQDKEMLRRDDEGAWVAAPEIDWDTLPVRVEAVVAERIDRLPQKLRGILTAASVEGEEFTAEVAARVEHENEREVVRLLSGELDKRHQLVRGEDIRRVDGQRLSRYRFRHVLFPRYLYQRLDRVERSYLHEEVGNTLESLLGDEADTAAVRLARHFEEAGLTAKAVDYLQRAGTRAVRLAANSQATEHLRRGLTLLEELAPTEERDRGELELQAALGLALNATSFGSGDAEKAYSRALELAGTAGMSARTLPIYFGIWVYSSTRALETSRDLARRIMEFAEHEGDDGLLLEACHTQWTESMFRGDVDAVIASHERGHALYRKEDHHALTFQYGNHDPGVCNLVFGALAYALRGDSVRAVKRLQEAHDLSTVLEHAPSRGQVLGYAGWITQILGDVDQTLACGERAMEAIRDHPFFRAVAQVSLGWGLAAKGRPGGVRELESAVENHRALGSYTTLAPPLALLAGCHIEQGRLDQAEATLNEALREQRKLGEGFYASELYRQQGELLARRGDSAEAEVWRRKALSTAEGQGAYALALRAALSLESAEDVARVLAHIPEDNDTPLAERARAYIRATSS